MITDMELLEVITSLVCLGTSNANRNAALRRILIYLKQIHKQKKKREFNMGGRCGSRTSCAALKVGFSSTPARKCLCAHTTTILQPGCSSRMYQFG